MQQTALRHGAVTLSLSLPKVVLHLLVHPTLGGRAKSQLQPYYHLGHDVNEFTAHVSSQISRPILTRLRPDHSKAQQSIEQVSRLTEQYEQVQKHQATWARAFVKERGLLSECEPNVIVRVVSDDLLG